MKLLKAKIHGKVQGVNLRFETMQKARELLLSGFVRNETDGTVYIEAQGEDSNVSKLLDWLEHEGPTFSKISKVETEFSQALKDFEGFSARV